MVNKYCEVLKSTNVDFIVITGDLHDYNDDYSKTKDFLNLLLSRLNLTSADIFIVPGNHDSQNYACKAADILYIREHIEKNQDCYKEYLTEDRLLKAFEKYKTFINDFYDGNNYKDSSNVQILTWNNSIDIILLNSALLCDGDNSQRQIIDINKLSELHNDRKSNLPAIVLSHHDLKSYYSNHSNTLRRLLIDLNVCAVLCGDAHLTSKDCIPRYDFNSGIPCIVCGKSAIEDGDMYSDVGFILYNVRTNGNIVSTSVKTYKWENDRKRFEETHIFSDDKGNQFTFETVLNNKKTSKKEPSKKNANKIYNSIWLPDAETASGKQTRFTTYTKTPIIENFVKNDSLKWGISAVKGIGKTFTLQIKKIKLTKQCLCLPLNITPSSENNWGIESISFNNIGEKKGLKEFNNIVNLWKFSLICYVVNQCINYLNKEEINLHKKDIIKNLSENLNNGRITQETYSLCCSKNYSTLNLVINGILSLKDWESIISNDYFVLQLLYSNFKDILNTLKKKYIAIFVDKIDQSIEPTQANLPADCQDCSKSNYFNECADPNKISIDYCLSSNCHNRCCFGCELFASPCSNVNLRIYDDKGKKAYEHINLWQYIQLSLVVAIDQIKQNFGGDIKIFYTIRQEAFACEQNRLGEQQKKILALTEKLYYNKEQQHQIFLDCIQHQEDEYLFDCRLKNSDRKEVAFVGIDKLCHPYVGETETVFDSIYRHSFDRTRDVQEYCQLLTDKMSKLKKCSNDSERGELIKQIIEEKAAVMAYNNNQADSSTDGCYYSEKLKFLPHYWADYANFESFILKIDRNLLFKEDLLQICLKINNMENCNGECDDYKCAKNPFSILYNLGFLGFIRVNESYGTTDKQVFIHSKDVTYIIDKNSLRFNDNVMYILHPALTKSIEKINKQHIKHFNGFILGKDIEVKKDKLIEILQDHKTLPKEVFEKKYYSKNYGKI